MTEEHEINTEDLSKFLEKKAKFRIKKFKHLLIQLLLFLFEGVFIYDCIYTFNWYGMFILVLPVLVLTTWLHCLFGSVVIDGEVYHSIF